MENLRSHRNKKRKVEDINDAEVDVDNEQIDSRDSDEDDKLGDCVHCGRTNVTVENKICEECTTPIHCTNCKKDTFAFIDADDTQRCEDCGHALEFTKDGFVKDDFVQGDDDDVEYEEKTEAEIALEKFEERSLVFGSEESESDSESADSTLSGVVSDEEDAESGEDSEDEEQSTKEDGDEDDFESFSSQSEKSETEQVDDDEEFDAEMIEEDCTDLDINGIKFQTN